MSEFDEVFSRLYASYRRIGSPDAVLAAVSGGADSTALLLALHRLQERQGVRVVCAHVDHGLRPSSGEDAAFVRGLSDDLHIPCRVSRVKVPHRGSLEAGAREARYAAFWQIAQDEGISCIATAHHRQDQAETMLMHLMYGTGTGGLAGMREWSRGLWRPFLDVDGALLKAMLERLGQAWRTDESNSDTGFTRNRIRMKLLPQMADIYPAFAKKMGETAAILADEDTALRGICAQWLDAHGHAESGLYWMERAAFLALHPALERRVLLLLAEKAGISLHFSAVESVLKSVREQASASVNLPGAASAYVTAERIHLLPQTEKDQPPLGRILWQTPAIQTGDGCFTQAFDADKIKGATLRTRRTGDTIVPLGQTGSQTLKQYMIDRKIDRPFRACWPVLAVGSDILWVIGTGASQHAALSRQTSRAVLAVYEGKLPDGRQRKEGTP